MSCRDISFDTKTKQRESQKQQRNWKQLVKRIPEDMIKPFIISRDNSRGIFFSFEGLLEMISINDFLQITVGMMTWHGQEMIPFYCSWITKRYRPSLWPVSFWHHHHHQLFIIIFIMSFSENLEDMYHSLYLMMMTMSFSLPVLFLPMFFPASLVMSEKQEKKRNKLWSHKMVHKREREEGHDSASASRDLWERTALWQHHHPYPHPVVVFFQVLEWNKTGSFIRAFFTRLLVPLYLFIHRLVLNNTCLVLSDEITLDLYYFRFIWRRRRFISVTV